MRSRYRRSVVVAAGLLFGAALAIASAAGSWGGRDAHGGVQSCNTQCQTRMTDCVQTCDQEPACMRGCGTRAVECVASCRELRPASDASVPVAPTAAARATADASAPLEGGAARDAGASDAARQDGGKFPREAGSAR